MSPPAPVGVHDDLATGEAGVALEMAERQCGDCGDYNYTFINGLLVCLFLTEGLIFLIPVLIIVN